MLPLPGPGLRPEVETARELPHDEEVGTLDDLAPERRGAEEHRGDDRRAQVRVEPKRLAQGEQRLLRPELPLQAVIPSTVTKAIFGTGS